MVPEDRDVCPSAPVTTPSNSAYTIYKSKKMPSWMAWDGNLDLSFHVGGLEIREHFVRVGLQHNQPIGTDVVQGQRLLEHPVVQVHNRILGNFLGEGRLEDLTEVLGGQVLSRNNLLGEAGFDRLVERAAQRKMYWRGGRLLAELALLLPPVAAAIQDI